MEKVRKYRLVAVWVLLAIGVLLVFNGHQFLGDGFVVASIPLAVWLLVSQLRHERAAKHALRKTLDHPIPVPSGLLDGLREDNLVSPCDAGHCECEEAVDEEG